MKTLKSIFGVAMLICSIGVQTIFAQQTSTFTDSRDSKKYKTVKIGTQTWMAENLDYAGKNNDIGVCYDRKPENCKKYGALYTWNEAMKVCPKGWHLPSDKEWQKLVDFAGGDKVAGALLKAKNDWPDGAFCGAKVTSGRGESKQYECDHFGFSALPGGYSNGDFYGIDISYVGSGLWWSASENYVNDAWYRFIDSGTAEMYRGSYPKSFLMSVRCVKN